MELTPFLMFAGTAQDAMHFYVSSFSDAEIARLDLYAAGEDGPQGSVKHGLVRIGTRTLRFFDSPVEHAFGFTPAISMFLDCDTADEVARLFGLLSDGGQVFMPLGMYPFAESFAWVADRYGVSWQLSYSPTV